MPLDEKQCYSGLVAGVEIHLIRPIPDVSGRRDIRRRLGSCHPGLERVVPIPNRDVVVVEVSRREGDGRRRIRCHRGWGLRYDCSSGRARVRGVLRLGERAIGGKGFLALSYSSPGYGRRSSAVFSFVDRRSRACGALCSSGFLNTNAVLSRIVRAQQTRRKYWKLCFTADSGGIP